MSLLLNILNPSDLRFTIPFKRESKYYCRQILIPLLIFFSYKERRFKILNLAANYLNPFEFYFLLGMNSKMAAKYYTPPPQKKWFLIQGLLERYMYFGSNGRVILKHYTHSRLCVRSSYFYLFVEVLIVK